VGPLPELKGLGEEKEETLSGEQSNGKRGGMDPSGCLPCASSNGVTLRGWRPPAAPMMRRRCAALRMADAIAECSVCRS